MLINTCIQEQRVKAVFESFSASGHLRDVDKRNECVSFK